MVENVNRVKYGFLNKWLKGGNGEDESRNMDVFEDDEYVMDISDMMEEIYYYSVDNQKV